MNEAVQYEYPIGARGANVGNKLLNYADFLKNRLSPA